MIESLTPLQLFGATWAIAALTGVGVLARSDTPMTPRTIFAALIYNGAAATGLGLTGYEYFGWKNKPALVLACGFLVGVRVISINDIRKRILRMLHEDGNNEPRKPE